ncbi:glycoside hydrolase [Methylomonas sp. LWB]|uniref:glycoside hydrolase family 57 protein n=1 Tax=Methylomonas sp. LWB TaxID=1905845 RepID=UPI0008DAE920|nr:1,4-alpha-glucan branching protein domain-containing protein [Methylomonas sp. LWB]OHX38039.1 glycoside hydrolase [Methylomonas sp. LWB]
MTKGYLAIVLHAHLPYVHHPEHASFFEENWLFEAITECYLPLLGVLERLHYDRIAYRLTLSLSPTLITMLGDALLQNRYLHYLQGRVELAEREVARTRGLPQFQALAEFYLRQYQDALYRYRERYRCELLPAFQFHHATGNLELTTTAATHGFLPLLNVSPAAVRNQIGVGLRCFESRFGFRPRGFWLPECGYYPGLEDELAAAGIDHFFVDSHALMTAANTAGLGVYAPLDCGNGVAAFGRDPASSRQVWSAEQGYPGDPDYREYYRDIGFDLPLEYVAPYILDRETRVNTGIKYYRITGQNQPKQAYQPAQAHAKARQHAADFVRRRREQIAALDGELSQAPIIVAPYDAELFGHWWYEGPLWLEQVLRLAAESDSGLTTAACSDYLQQPLRHGIGRPAASSWGEHGYSSYWLNESNDWIYPLLHRAAAEMEKLANDLNGLKITPAQERALNQAARSLLLAQASDWPFIMKAGTTVDYARKRIADHLARFNYLHDAIRKNRIDERYLTALEIMDDIFPDIDFRDYAG